jgi:two-component system phosphate regulon sensor histidine kinase PhoR
MNSPEEKRELLSLISHELRSPAAVVAGYLRLLLRDDVEMSERARQLIREAEKSSTRILALVKELSELAVLSSEDGAGALTGVPIFSLCADAVRGAAGDRSDVAFSYEGPDQETLVSADPAQLKRALGAVLQVTLRERGDRPLEVGGFIARDEARTDAVIAFGDPGIATASAIVLAAREQLFERWRGGTGLSVPIACRIFELYSGRCWGLPENSRAACAVSLPIVQGESRPIDEAASLSEVRDSSVAAT